MKMRCRNHTAWIVALILILIGSFLSSCAGSDASGETRLEGERELVVFTAASLTESFQELERLFEQQHRGVDVKLNVAGTQVLRSQVEQGAHGDLFASADVFHLRALAEEGLAEKERMFAYNELVVLLPKSNPAEIQTLRDLAEKRARLVIGSENVPVGTYTRAFLDKADLYFGHGYKAKFLQNVVSLETNVKLVARKVALGEADAGIVYPTELTPDILRDTEILPIPSELNVQGAYAIAVLRGTRQPELAQAWIDMLLSEEGQRILAAHRLTTLEGTEK